MTLSRPPEEKATEEEKWAFRIVRVAHKIDEAYCTLHNVPPSYLPQIERYGRLATKDMVLTTIQMLLPNLKFNTLEDMVNHAHEIVRKNPEIEQQIQRKRPFANTVSDAVRRAYLIVKFHRDLTTEDIAQLSGNTHSLGPITSGAAVSASTFLEIIKKAFDINSIEELITTAEKLPIPTYKEYREKFGGHIGSGHRGIRYYLEDVNLRPERGRT